VGWKRGGRSLRPPFSPELAEQVFGRNLKEELLRPTHRGTRDLNLTVDDPRDAKNHGNPLILW
jgi:hypothetical protein